MKKPGLAIKVYERVPANSALRRNAVIQMASNLDALDRGDEAEKHLETVIKEHPDDVEAIMALGNVLRGHKKFAECADVYFKAVAAMGAPDKSNWTVFYFRGICYERSKQWPKAEADLKKALELFPDQPHVLNYLGYSWIDQGINLDQGMDMIKKAVQQRPDDGYIVTRSAGPISRSAITKRRRRTSSAPSSSSRKTRPSTITWATPIGGSAVCWKPNSSGRMRAISSPSRRSCRRSRKSSRMGCRTRHPRRPRRARRSATG